MLRDLLLELDIYIDCRKLILNLDNFIDFTDYDIISMARMYKDKNIKIKNILDKISHHQLYSLVFSKTIDKTDKEFTLNDFLNDFSNDDLFLLKDKFILHQSNIGYISGNKSNPLDNIFLYSTKNDDIVKLLDSDLTKLMPDNFQETVIMIFYVNKDETVEHIKKLLKL
jgi:hypothetical protein